MNSEKIMYKNFMVGKTDKLEYEGKEFTETPMSSKTGRKTDKKKEN
jgi:hypothetical protein